MPQPHGLRMTTYISFRQKKRNQARSLNIRKSMLTILTTRWLMTMTFKKVIGQKDVATATGMLTHTTDVAKITKDSVTRKNRTQ